MWVGRQATINASRVKMSIRFMARAHFAYKKVRKAIPNRSTQQHVVAAATEAIATAAATCCF